MFSVSYSTMATPESTLAQKLAYARAFGYNGIDIRISDKKGELTLAATETECAAIKRAFQEEGVAIQSVFSYNDVIDETTASETRSRDSIVKNAELTHALGAKAMRIFGGNPHAFDNADAYVTRFAGVIETALTMIPSEVALVIQNHVGSLSARETLAIAKTLASPRVGLAYSPDHTVIMGEETWLCYEEARPYVKQIYVSDGVWDENGNWAGTLPGEGIVPNDVIIKNAIAHPPEFGISCKWEKLWRAYLPTADVALPRFMEYLARITGTRIT